MDCVYCQASIPSERAELGYTHCMARACQQAHTSEWASGYRMMLVPKQGYIPVRVDSPEMKSGGRSSGRS